MLVPSDKAKSLLFGIYADSRPTAHRLLQYAHSRPRASEVMLWYLLTVFGRT